MAIHFFFVFFCKNRELFLRPKLKHEKQQANFPGTQTWKKKSSWKNCFHSVSHVFTDRGKKIRNFFMQPKIFFHTQKKDADNFLHLKIKWFLVIYLLNNNIYWFIFLHHHLLSNLCRFDFGSFSPPYIASLSTIWLFDKWFITHGYFGESRCLLMYSICK